MEEFVQDIEETKKRKREEQEKQREEKLKQMKKDKKDALKEKKSYSKPNFLLIDGLKQEWERFRQENSFIKNRKNSKPTPEFTKKLAKRDASLQKILEGAQGKLEDISKHADASRIIQSLVKHGNPKQLEAIYQELKGKFVSLMEDIYGHYIVKRFLFYASKEIREKVFAEWRGKIVDLLVEKYPAVVLDYYYSELSSAKQKKEMIREFYGHDFLFDDDYVTLSELLKKHPGKKLTIMNTLGKALRKQIEKGMSNLEMVQKLMVDFYENGDLGGIIDLVMDMEEVIPHILHTKNGSLASMYCISYASPQLRKKLIKSMKGLVMKAAVDSYGYKVIAKFLTVVEDTKLLEKTIVKEFLDDLPQVMTNTYGCKMLVHIFKGDMKNDKTIQKETKKDLSKIREEILEQVIPKLNEYFVNTPEWKENLPCHEVLQCLAAEEKCDDKILLPFVDQVITPSISRCISKRIMSSPSFAEAFLEKIERDLLGFLKDKKGDFVLAALAKSEKFRTRILKKIKPEKAKEHSLLYKILTDPK